MSAATGGANAMLRGGSFSGATDSAPAADVIVAVPATDAIDAPTIGPTRTVQLLNFVIFQAAWFAAVIGAAQRIPLWGTACVVAAIGWHVGASARPRQEAKLIAVVCVFGFIVESLMASSGYVRYPSGQPDPNFAPYWMVALWGLMGITLNVTMRWLKRRLLLAALLGAALGPVSFASGVSLGGAQFVDANAAIFVMACGWAVSMPALMWLSNRFDGVGAVSALTPPEADGEEPALLPLSPEGGRGEGRAAAPVQLDHHRFQHPDERPPSTSSNTSPTERRNG